MALSGISLLRPSVSGIGPKMNLPGISRIYHGGGTSGNSGYSSGGVVPPPAAAYMYDRLYVSANDFKAYPAFPPNGPSVRTLPNTLVTNVYSFNPSELDIIFAWVHLPSRYWKYQIAAPTDFRLTLHSYVDSASAAPNDVILWKAAVMYFRDMENLNVAGPAMTDIRKSCGTFSYQLCENVQNNFPILNPSGSIVETEGMFYIKIERVGNDAADTYPNEAHFLGASIDIPLRY